MEEILQKNMKNEYAICKEYESILEQQIATDEGSIFLNKKLLTFIKQEIAKLPLPKSMKPTKPEGTA